MFAAIFEREDFTRESPVFRPLHQSGPNRVFPDVVPFLGRGFVAAKNMIEYSLLPMRRCYLSLAPRVRQCVFERLGPDREGDLFIVVGEKEMAMIWHQDVATDPGAVLWPSQRESNKRVVQMRMGEDLPSLRDIGGNEIDGVPDDDSIETRQAAFHGSLLRGN